ncbi:MAG: hypothetical protein SGI72_11490 [Planctomycetota bacterium]|nr:hypothetical protein [Planctomycetota bacterium]
MKRLFQKCGWRSLLLAALILTVISQWLETHAEVSKQRHRTQTVMASNSNPAQQTLAFPTPPGDPLLRKTR